MDERTGPEARLGESGPLPSAVRTAMSRPALPAARRRRGLRAWLLPGELVFVVAWVVASALVFRFMVGSKEYQASGTRVAVVFTVATGIMVAAIVVFSRLSSRRVRVGLLDADMALESMELVTDPALSFLPLDELLEELLRRTSQVVGGDMATIFLLTADGKSVSVRASHGADPVAAGDQVPIGFGVIGTVAARGQAAIVDDVARVTPMMPALRDRVSSLMAAPLLVAGKVIGVVQVGTRELHGFGERDLHLLQLVAERAAASIERARLDESERRSRLGAEQARRHLDMLARAGEVLATALESYESAFIRLVEVVVPAFADWFAIDLVGDDGRMERVAYGARGEAPHGPAEAATQPAGRPGETGFHRHRHPDGDRLIRRALTTGRPEVVLNKKRLGPPHPGQLAERGYTDAAPASGVESMIVVPVHVRGLAFGALSLVTGTGRRGYRRSDLDTALGLAGRVAITVERVLLWRETREAEVAATRNASQLRRLVEAALGVNAPLEEPEVLRVLAEHARHVLGADWAVIGAAAPKGRVTTELVSPPGAVRAAGVDTDVVEAALQEVLGARPPVRSSTTRRREGPASLGVPLPGAVGEGKRKAVVVFAADGRPFGPEAESMLLLLTQMASVALENARLYQAVQGNEERLRAVVESSPLSIAELDLDGQARWWNGAAALLFGWPAPGDPEEPGERPEGRRPLPVRDEDSVELRALLERARAGLATVGAELRSVRPDGRPLDLSMSTAPLRDHAGVVRGILAVMEDATERLQMLEQFHQAERLGAMARLAGAVAHDFNNLLTVILGSSEMLLRQLSEQGPRDEVAAIQRAGQRAAALTSQLLAIGQRPPVQPVVTDPDVAMESMIPMLERALGSRVAVQHVPATTPTRVLVDPAELERAVLNLALNANDAMPDGGKFTIATLPLDGGRDGSREVAIRVSDEGTGMDSQTAAHCFEPFFTTKGHARGTGLGLAAVHAFVTQAGGRVSVDSAPGLGTAFTLVFPHADGEVAEGPGGDVVAEPELSSGEETVLVVEDEPELRRLTVQALEWRGYHVLAAGDGDEALAVARGLRRRPDLLVTDVVMPAMSGVELVEQLHKRWRTLPVLFVSGHLGQEALGDDPLGRPADFLAKPFTPDELGRRVRQALDRARSRGDRPVGQQSTAG